MAVKVQQVFNKKNNPKEKKSKSSVFLTQTSYSLPQWQAFLLDKTSIKYKGRRLQVRE